MDQTPDAKPPAQTEAPIKKSHPFLWFYLVVLIVALVAGGIYAWQHNKVKDLEQQKIAQANQLKDLQSQLSSMPASTGSITSSSKYLDVAEWRVKAPYSGGQHIQYAFVKGYPNTVYIYSSEIVGDKPNCAGYTASVSRYKPTDPYGVQGRETAEQVAKNTLKSTYGFVGGYYYLVTGPQALCPDATPDSALAKKLIELHSSITALLPKLKTY